METTSLSREDRAILELEGPHIVGHICKVIVVESAPSIEALRKRIESRLQWAPMLRWCLGEGSDGPVWQQNSAVDFSAHVVESGVAADAAELRRQVAVLFAQHLDRRRPLWKIDIIRLPSDAVALVWRIHHALADGTTCMKLGEAVLWESAHPSEMVAIPHVRAADASLPDDHRRRGHLAAFLSREFAESLGRSPFDGTVGSRRSIAFASVPLAEVHDAAHRLANASVNDAILSIVTGALRRWLIHHHGSLGTIRLRVPVSLHHEGEDPGNRDSFFTLPVSLHEADPVVRLLEIHAETTKRKEGHDAEQLESLLTTLGGVSSMLKRFVEQIQASPRSFALGISNVPGPRNPIEVCGGSVRSLHSLAEVGKRHGLRVAVASLAGTLGFGICADPGIVPGVDALATGIEAEAQALFTAGGRDRRRD